MDQKGPSPDPREKVKISTPRDASWLDDFSSSSKGGHLRARLSKTQAKPFLLLISAILLFGALFAGLIILERRSQSESNATLLVHQEKLTQAKVAEAEAAQATLARTKAAEARAAQAQSVEARLAAVKLAEARAAQAKLTQAKSAAARKAEAKLAAAKLAEAKAAEAKLEQAKLAAAKAARAQAAQVKLAQEKAAEAKLAQANLAQEKSAQAKAAQVKGAPQKAPQATPAPRQTAAAKAASAKPSHAAVESKPVQSPPAEAKPSPAMPKPLPQKEVAMASPSPAPSTRSSPHSLAAPPESKGPSVLASCAPEYPQEEFEQGIEGTVDLTVLVGANGKPEEIKVSKSSGDGELDQAAIRSVRECWKFAPLTVGGTPVRSYLSIPVVFSLH